MVFRLHAGTLILLAFCVWPALGMADEQPNTALTSTVNPEEPYRLFDITIRAAVLGEDLSELLTQKERTCFDTAGSSLSLSIEAGQLDAIVYVLVHEATHVVDSSLRITRVIRPGDRPLSCSRIFASIVASFTSARLRMRTTFASSDSSSPGFASAAEDGHQVHHVRKCTGIWCLELEARGKGKASDIDKELRANLLPGLTIVPAMVIAIDKAQEAGIKYNRQ